MLTHSFVRFDFYILAFELYSALCVCHIKKIPISMFCIRRKLQKCGLQEEPEGSENPPKNPVPSKSLPRKTLQHKQHTPISLCGQQLLIDHQQFIDITKDCSKGRGNFSFAAAPWSTLSFLSQGNVSNSSCKELPLCLQRWPVQKFWKCLFAKNYWATPQRNTQNIQLTLPSNPQSSSFGDSEANPLKKQEK